MIKNRADQNGANGSCATAAGYATNAKPGPIEEKKASSSLSFQNLFITWISDFTNLFSFGFCHKSNNRKNDKTTN